MPKSKIPLPAGYQPRVILHVFAYIARGSAQMRKAELAALPVSLACATFSLPVRLWNIFCNKIEKEEK